jgi:hypothetical protein
MSRIKLYPNDSSITGGDRLIGTDINGNATKNYQIEEIAKYFARSGTADATALGFQYSYAGKYENNAIGSSEFRYKINQTAPLQFGWANITGIAISKYSISGVDISPIAYLFDDQIIKITDIGNGSPLNYGSYLVSNISELTNAYLFSLTHKGSSGDPSTSVITIAATGISVNDKFFTFTQASASATWAIQHNLEKFPSVTVIDSANDVVYGNTTYIDENNLTINFSAPFSGKAYLN